MGLGQVTLLPGDTHLCLEPFLLDSTECVNKYIQSRKLVAGHPTIGRGKGGVLLGTLWWTGYGGLAMEPLLGIGGLSAAGQAEIWFVLLLVQS